MFGDFWGILKTSLVKKKLLFEATLEKTGLILNTLSGHTPQAQGNVKTTIQDSYQGQIHQSVDDGERDELHDEHELLLAP